MAISGEDVAAEFKQSGLFDSILSDVSALISKNLRKRHAIAVAAVQMLA